jgi:2-keto-4-pentenoate hydratase
MDLSPADVAEGARLLDRARLDRVPIAVLTERWPNLDERDAYAIQDAGVALAASAPLGFKLGYTSKAMRIQMGVDRPNYGRLHEGTRIPNGGELEMDRLIHPLIEPEIALLIGADMEVDSVMPALEIVDTRYVDYTFTAFDNIADNSSAARFVLGTPRSLRAIGDLRSLPATLYADESIVAQGNGSDALGDPLLALAWLINQLGRNGATIEAGAIVLTGGLTRAQVIEHRSHFRANFGPLGEVSVRVRPASDGS